MPGRPPRGYVGREPDTEDEIVLTFRRMYKDGSLATHCEQVLAAAARGELVPPLRSRERQIAVEREAKDMKAAEQVMAFFEEVKVVHKRPNEPIIHTVADGAGINPSYVYEVLRSLEATNKIVRSGNKRRTDWIALKGFEPEIIAPRAIAPAPPRALSPVAEPPTPVPAGSVGMSTPTPVAASPPAPEGIDYDRLATVFLAQAAQAVVDLKEFETLQESYASAVDEIATLRQQVIDLEEALSESKAQIRPSIGLSEDQRAAIRAAS